MGVVKTASTLPQALVLLSHSVEAMEKAFSLESAPSLAGIRVLLVEDSEDTREAFVRLLTLEGATVAAAENAREAAELAVGAEFDVLLTDLGLPDISGDALITTVIATARRRPKVVVVTGYGEPHVSRAREAGADVVLVKPVMWHRLIEHLAGPAPAAVPAAA
ncbi:MAG: response regulator [Candidatus Rokubacteria bacterium]|nr:response regulator [Candidatus Rokubacteria bacterium]